MTNIQTYSKLKPYHFGQGKSFDKVNFSLMIESFQAKANKAHELENRFLMTLYCGLYLFLLILYFYLGDVRSLGNLNSNGNGWAGVGSIFAITSGAVASIVCIINPFFIVKGCFSIMEISEQISQICKKLGVSPRDVNAVLYNIDRKPQARFSYSFVKRANLSFRFGMVLFAFLIAFGIKMYLTNATWEGKTNLGTHALYSVKTGARVSEPYTKYRDNDAGKFLPVVFGVCLIGVSLRSAVKTKNLIK